MKRKVITAAAAAELISDGDTVTTSGFVGIGVPEELLIALEARFVETGQPKDSPVTFPLTTYPIEVAGDQLVLTFIY